ncbi:hypothetical protein IEQ34_004386 [Dendrobium chrysotoxum]|uniref:Uncharacterized protein n=1 Tax=Dendrobium chrysotoxum TaxID=161865 RepID=A0AAV7HI96_DENCH|nr:hypothetical protein IEQ34_004386 [Dendrobium chrysotoxum]
MDSTKIPWFHHPKPSWSLVYLVRGGSRPNLTEGSLSAAMGCVVQGDHVNLGPNFGSLPETPLFRRKSKRLAFPLSLLERFRGVSQYRSCGQIGGIGDSWRIEFAGRKDVEEAWTLWLLAIGESARRGMKRRAAASLSQRTKVDGTPAMRMVIRDQPVTKTRLMEVMPSLAKIRDFLRQKKQMIGGSLFSRAKEAIYRRGLSRGGSSRGESSRETETPSTQVHLDSQ